MLSGWNETIPIGITQLAGIDPHAYSGPYDDSQTLYFNWSSINQGTASSGAYRVHVEVTGTGGGTWDWDIFSSNVGQYHWLTNDQPVGPLAAGNHTFKVWLDHLGVVEELDDQNDLWFNIAKQISELCP